MLRLVLSVVAGFIGWLIVWFAGEKLLSAILPEAFGAPQRAFQDALTNGGQLRADTRLLLMHLVLVTIVSTACGALAALIAGENSRAPMILAILLLLIGVAKAVMSWNYVPIWYHVGFTVLLVAMAIVGGRLVPAN